MTGLFSHYLLSIGMDSFSDCETCVSTPILEPSSVIINISYLVNILLLLTLFFSFRQLKQSNEHHKQNLDNRSRDLALSTSHRFISDFMTEQIEFQTVKQDTGVKNLQVTIITFDKSDIYNLEMTDAELKDYFDRHLINKRKEIAKLINHLESIAMYFQVGGADKELGYNAIGNDFVDVFEQMYVDTQISSNFRIKQYSPHAVSLYKEWRPKRDEFLKNFENPQS